MNLQPALKPAPLVRNAGATVLIQDNPGGPSAGERNAVG